MTHNFAIGCWKIMKKKRCVDAEPLYHSTCVRSFSTSYNRIPNKIDTHLTSQKALLCLTALFFTTKFILEIFTPEYQIRSKVINTMRTKLIAISWLVVDRNAKIPMLIWTPNSITRQNKSPSEFIFPITYKVGFNHLKWKQVNM